MKKAVATKKAATQNKVASQKWDTINIKMRPLINGSTGLMLWCGRGGSRGAIAKK